MSLLYLYPINIIPYSPETRPDVVRMQGYINRAKVRVRGGEADGAGYELCEIKEAKLSHVDESSPAPPPDSSVKGDLFFCDFREPRATDAARYRKILFPHFLFITFSSSSLSFTFISFPLFPIRFYCPPFLLYFDFPIYGNISRTCTVTSSSSFS